MEVIWRREWLLYDLANVCNAMAQACGSSKEAAVLQMLCDVCRTGNVDRMSRVFQLSMSEIRREIVGMKRWRELNSFENFNSIDNSLEEKDYSIELGDVSLPDAEWIRDTVQDYLVMAAIADWINVVVGVSEARHWEVRADDAYRNAMDAIYTVGAKGREGIYQRRITPI